MDLVIKNGTIVTATDMYEADIGIEGEKIVAIGKELSGSKEIDAKGMMIFPGFIDVHTHIEMPFMGTYSSDTWETGTRAAAFGGTTCVVDFIIQSKGGTLKAALDEWNKRSTGNAYIDYGYHMGMTDVNDDTVKEMETMILEEGIPSFKLFFAYKGSLMSNDDAFYKALEKAGEFGGLIMLHAENGHIIDLYTKRLLAENKTEPMYHAVSRPSILEGEACQRAITLAELAEAPLYIVHNSCLEAVEAIHEGRERGLPIYGETCPQYLTLDEERYTEGDFNGAKYVMSPPLRSEFDQDALWFAIERGDLQVISTDHCPFFFKGQKEMGKDNFAKIPNGAPGLETRMAVMYTAGVLEDWITINKFVELNSTNPAKLFGLFPQKGTIAVGSDADIVVFDPEKEVTISVKNLHQNTDYTPWEGMVVKGYPVTVLSRGKVVVEDGKLTGEKGWGKFVKRDRFYPL
jgi:dihydropyrimidinase